MKLNFAKLTASLACLASFAFGADKTIQLNIQEALDGEFGKKLLNKNVSFIFGSGYNGEVIKGAKFHKTTSRFGKTNQKENLSAKFLGESGIKKQSTEETVARACQYVFIVVLKNAQDLAISKGYTKVVNIKTYFKFNELDSKDEFICGYNRVKNVGIEFDFAKS